MDKNIKQIIPLWKILLFSFGFFGVQLCVMSFIISLPQFAGHYDSFMGNSSYLWLSIPILGIFVQPIIGFVGDHQWGEYGRRGFFIVLASSFGSVAIFMIALSHNIVSSLIFVFIAIICINALVVSYRALITEMTPVGERFVGYCILSILQFFGMLVAIVLKYTLGTASYEINYYKGVLPPDIALLMMILAVVLILTAFLGNMFLREYPNLGFKSLKSYVPYCGVTEREIIKDDGISYLRQGAMWLSVTFLLFMVFYSSDFSGEVYTIIFTMFVFAIMLMVVHRYNTSKYFLSRRQKQFVEIMNDVMNMPIVMKKLNVVMLTAWFGIFLFLYNFPFIIKENIMVNFLMQNKLYLGMDAVTNGYLLFIIIGMVFTPIIAFIGKYLPIRFILSSTILLSIFSMMIFYFIPHSFLFFIMMVVFGILLAVMFSAPFTLLSFKLPTKRVGVFIGLFNMFMVVPYVLVPSVSNSLVVSVGGVHTHTIVLSVLSLVVAFIFSALITAKE